MVKKSIQTLTSIYFQHMVLQIFDQSIKKVRTERYSRLNANFCMIITEFIDGLKDLFVMKKINLCEKRN